MFLKLTLWGYGLQSPLNLREEFLPGPGFEPGAAALRPDAPPTASPSRITSIMTFLYVSLK